MSHWNIIPVKITSWSQPNVDQTSLHKQFGVFGGADSVCFESTDLLKVSLVGDRGNGSRCIPPYLTGHDKTFEISIRDKCFLLG